MNLVSIRIITDNVKALVAFYGKITGVQPVQFTESFAELQTKNGTLAIGGSDTLQLFGGSHVAKAASNHSAIIEFKVDDVDAEYDDLKDFLGDALVQQPTTMPWGNRSLLFRETATWLTSSPQLLLMLSKSLKGNNWCSILLCQPRKWLNMISPG